MRQRPIIPIVRSASSGRVAVLVAVVLAVAALGTPSAGALAGEPVERGDRRVLREEHRDLSVTCAAATAAGSVHVLLAVDGAGRGLIALNVWDPGQDPTEIPSFGTDVEEPENHVTFDGSRIDAQAPLFDRTQVRVGDVETSVALTFGPWVTSRETVHGGNRTTRSTETARDVDGSGTVTLFDGRTFDLSSCDGREVSLSMATSNPRAHIVDSDDDEVLECTVTTAAGTLELEVGSPNVEVRLTAPGAEEPWLAAFAHSHDRWGLAAGHVATALEVYERDGNALGDGTLELWTAPTGHELVSTMRYQRGFLRTSAAQLVATSGQLVLPVTDGVFDLTGCMGWVFSAHGVTMDSARPATGPAATNDTAASPTPLEPGARVAQQTGGATRAAEHEPSCMFDDASHEQIPTGHTVWFSFQGTDAPVTLDTAGSLFDTVVSVYVVSEGSLVEVACASESGEFPDVTLQPALTLPTSAGVTYLVQVGGYLYDFGALKLARRG